MRTATRDRGAEVPHAAEGHATGMSPGAPTRRSPRRGPREWAGRGPALPSKARPRGEGPGPDAPGPATRPAGAGPTRARDPGQDRGEVMAGAGRGRERAPGGGRPWARGEGRVSLVRPRERGGRGRGLQPQRQLLGNPFQPCSPAILQ